MAIAPAPIAGRRGAVPTGGSRRLLTLVGAAQFLVVLDLTIVNLALPALQADLELSPTSLHWVVTGYAVGFGGFLLTAGRLADLVGRRRLFTAGLVTFTLASLACGLSPSGEALLAARAVQGLGAAALSPAGFAILLAAFPPGAARHRAMAAWASIGSLAAVTGIVAGGLLTELVGWRSVFLVNVPVGLVAFATTHRLVPADALRRRRPVDVRAGLLATAGLGALVFVLSNGPVAGWASIGTVATAAAGAVAFGAFAARERGAAAPLLPREVLADRRFLLAGGVGLAQGAVMLGMLVLLAVYLQGGRGLSAVESAGALLLLRLPSVGWASVVGRLLSRFGPHPFLVLGSGLMTAGLVLLAQLPADGPMAATLVPALLLLGLGVPCVFVAISAASVGEAGPEHAGVAAGLMKAFQWIGGAVGLALVAAATGGLDASAQDPDVLLEHVRVGFFVCAALAALGLVLACLGAARPGARTASVAA